VHTTREQSASPLFSVVDNKPLQGHDRVLGLGEEDAHTHCPEEECRREFMVADTILPVRSDAGDGRARVPAVAAVAVTYENEDDTAECMAWLLTSRYPCGGSSWWTTDRSMAPSSNSPRASPRFPK
jgi:hypothetical protein